MSNRLFDRRRLLAGSASLAALALAGCATTESPRLSLAAAREPGKTAVPADILAMYGPLPDEKFPIPAARIGLVDPRYWRQAVDDPTGEAPGTVVVSTAERMLYLVGENGRAMRYGVGIGRQGFAWSGRGVIQWKQAWPKWTPPDEMVKRQPELVKYSGANGGMPGGLNNPLGARALYIFQNGQDTLYRLHGSPEWKSIGKAVSSGCVRMLNQDVIDLYDRVKGKAPILVI